MPNIDIVNLNEVELDLIQLQTQRLLKLQTYISCLEQKQKQLLSRSQSIHQVQPAIKRQISLPVTCNSTNGSNSLNDLCFPSLNTLTELSKSQTIVPPLPQAPCVALQRRDSSKSDGSQSPTDVSSSRYKTEMCRPFEETGHCRYGSKCQFAHGSHELRSLNRHPRYKTEYCRTFHTTGFCSYGQRCNFIHNEDERRPQQQPVNRPQALNINRHMPLTLQNSTGSTGSSPASSIYGDMSPTHSPSYLADDIFARRSPTPSYSSDSSFPSPPPGLALPENFFDNGNTMLTTSLDRLSLSLLNSLNF